MRRVGPVYAQFGKKGAAAGPAACGKLMSRRYG